MPGPIPLIVAYVFLGVFIVCVLAGLAVMLEWWTPRNKRVGTWLVTGVIMSVAGAVVTFGTNIYGGKGGAAAAETPTPPGPAPSPPTTAAPGPSPTPSPSPAPTASPAPQTAGVPEALQEWVGAKLGSRPTLAEISAHPYPACVDELRALAPDAVLTEDANACGRALNRYHTNYLLAYYHVKAPYSANLDSQEEQLRLQLPAPDARERYAFVGAEIARLNGEEWDSIVALERRLADDISSCKRRKCRAG